MAHPSASRALQILLLFLTGLVLPGPAHSQVAVGGQQRLERLVQILDYLGVDYAVAVRDGEVISAPEYREMRSFADQARELALELPEGSDREALVTGIGELERAIEAKAAPAAISRRTGELQSLLLTRFPVKAAPKALPDMARGAALYRTHCAGCHGAEGRGDGPRAEGMSPPPVDFHDEQRVFQRSPFGFYTTITHGLDGTAMAGYRDRLSQTERWDLAFYVASIPFSAEAMAEGRRQLAAASGQWARVVPGLGALATTPTENLLERGGEDARPVVALLRRHPAAVEENANLPLAVTRQKMAASMAAFREGRNGEARRLAIAAYLDGFEPMEPRLDAVDHRLRLEVEEALTRFRGVVAEDGGLRRAEALYERIRAGLDRVEERLGAGTLSGKVAFVSSLGILLREGLEALLVVGAIVTVLVRTGQRGGLPYVHLGWILALVAGAGTWYAAQGLVQVSGAGREVVEGLSGLVAAVILFYVSYWFVTKVEARKWQAFIQAKVDAAVNRGALWLLAGVVFLAVYREVFETILFYQALWAQGGEAAGMRAGVLGGIGVAAVILVGVGWGIFRAGVRLPLKAFFLASSALLFVLALVLSGKGMLALQEAGWIDPVPVPFLRLDLLGIYPYAAPLALQGVLVLVMGASLAWSLRGSGDGREAGGSQT